MRPSSHCSWRGQSHSSRRLGSLAPWPCCCPRQARQHGLAPAISGTAGAQQAARLPPSHTPRNQLVHNLFLSSACRRNQEQQYFISSLTFAQLSSCHEDAPAKRIPSLFKCFLLQNISVIHFLKFALTKNST